MRCYRLRCVLEIRDNYPKYVLRKDEFAGRNYEGIKTMHVADFLLSEEFWLLGIIVAENFVVVVHDQYFIEY